MASVRFVDETGFSIGWIHPEPGWMERAGHAIAHDGRVWVIDPPDGDGVEERIRALGEPAGVVQLLDRHDRDGFALAGRLGVPLQQLPFHGVAHAPFQAIPVVDLPLWKEVALWFPEERALVVSEALGASRAYRAPGERVGVHPMLRLLPPRKLRGRRPDHLLLGHGQGVHGSDTEAAVDDAVAGSRRRIPALALGLVRGARSPST